MKGIINKKIWGYLGRFSIVHLIVYTLISTAFLIFQDALPASERVALDFFKPYHQVSLIVICNQLIKGGVMALILYPFYGKLLSSDRGWLILFGAIWGLALLGSVQPMPGSIEGLLYTTTTLAEHIVVLIAGAVQALLFSAILLNWEKRNNYQRSFTEVISKYSFSGLIRYFGRFTLIHMLTYVVIGFVFYNVQNYEGALDTMEAFKLYRNLEDPIVAAAVLPVQVIRGGLLALYIYPFYSNFIKKEKGWLLLFVLLYGFTFAILLLSDFVETIITGLSITDILIGPLEVTVQMLVFSWLFFKWERRKG